MVDMAMNFKLPPSVDGALLATAAKLNSLGVKDFLDPELSDPATFLIGRSGKLFRPAILFMGALAIKANPLGYIDLAVAVELLHNSSLMHDDVIDGDDTRRGGIAVHKKYGRHAAIIAGDALISKAVQQACLYGAPVVEYVSRISMEMCDGEMIDYDCQKSRTVPGMAKYLRIIGLKSASLIGASAAAPAVYKGLAISKELESFGRDVGMAFQIRDDVIDWLGLEIRDSLPSSADSAAFRPNVISSLSSDADIGPEKALAEAVKLNNSYVDRAVSCANGIGAVELAPYAEIVRLKMDDVTRRQ